MTDELVRLNVDFEEEPQPTSDASGIESKLSHDEGGLRSFFNEYISGAVVKAFFRDKVAAARHYHAASKVVGIPQELKDIARDKYCHAEAEVYQT